MILKLLGESWKLARAEYDQRNAEQLRAVLLKRLKRGEHWAVSDDATAAAMFTIQRVAQEGVARKNLELIVEAFSNAAQLPTFAPDEFRRHVYSLASLSAEEVRLIGQYVRARRKLMDAMAGQEPDALDLWGRLIDTLVGSATFKEPIHVEMFAGALTRTGWFVSLGAYSGRSSYRSTPLFTDMMRLVDWDAAISDA
jgi:uncharacterized protein YjeT (DUF2065 family)